MVTAMSNGAVDSGILADPIATIAAERGVAVKWKELVDLHDRLQITVILFGPQFAVREPDVGRRWMLAYLKGVRDYTDAFFKGRDRAGAIEVLTKWTPVKDAALYDRMAYANIDPNGGVNEASMAQDIDWWVRQRLLDGPVDLANVIDRRYAEQAVQTLGRY
jgi:NitT/TauT family transport system substrate-binding protein